MNELYLFFALMLSGTFFLGYNDFQKKKYLNRGINRQILLCGIFLGGSLFLFIPIFFTGVPILAPIFWWAITGTVLLNVLSQNLFIRAYSLSEASLVSPLLLVTPIIVIGTGFLFLHEMPSFLGSLGIIVTVIGLWFLIAPDFHRFTHLEPGLIYGLFAAVLFAVSFPLDKLAVVSSSALFTGAITFFSIAFITFVLNIFHNKKFPLLFISSVRENSISFVVMSFVFGCGIFLTNQALNYSLAAYASSLKRLQVFWTILLSGSLLGEKNIGRKLLATAIMFSGVFLSVIFH